MTDDALWKEAERRVLEKCFKATHEKSGAEIRVLFPLTAVAVAVEMGNEAEKRGFDKGVIQEAASCLAHLRSKPPVTIPCPHCPPENRCGVTVVPAAIIGPQPLAERCPLCNSNNPKKLNAACSGRYPTEHAWHNTPHRSSPPARGEER